MDKQSQARKNRTVRNNGEINFSPLCFPFCSNSNVPWAPLRRKHHFHGTSGGRGSSDSVLPVPGPSLGWSVACRSNGGGVKHWTRGPVACLLNTPQTRNAPAQRRCVVWLELETKVSQSRRRSLLGHSPCWKRLLSLSHLRHLLRVSETSNFAKVRLQL